MTPEQENDAVELSRRVLACYFKSLADDCDADGDPDLCSILTDMAHLLRSSNDHEIHALREAVRAAWRESWR